MLKMSALLILLVLSTSALSLAWLIDRLPRTLARTLARQSGQRRLSEKWTKGFWIGAAFALGLPFSTTQAVAQNSQICSGYARDYAQRNTRGRAAAGAARGAIGGALIGGIANDRRGARRGAGIGGATGAVIGGVNQSQDFTVLYNQAYRRCMRR